MMHKIFAKIKDKPQKKNNFYFVTKFSSIRIAFLGMYLAVLIALKYVLGFVLGIELVTFMFVFAGLFFPIKDGIFLILAFNFGVMAMYGFGTWELMYYVLWPIDFFGAKIISKFTKNKYAIALWGFFCGLSLIWWYFLSDLYFFGSSFAIANIISAIPVNLVEGFTTAITIFLIGTPMSKLFATYSLQFWNLSNPFAFKKFKNEKIHIWISLILILFMIGAIITLFIYNNWFLELKAKLFTIGEASFV